VFIGGHSHIQMHRRHGEKLFLNSGSIGNAFKFAFSPGNPPSLLPWAEYAIVEQDDCLNISEQATCPVQTGGFDSISTANTNLNLTNAAWRRIVDSIL